MNVKRIKFLERLAKLHRMMGSTNANERDNARIKLEKLLAQNKCTWNDLSDLLHEAKLLESRTEKAKPPDGAGQTIPNIFDLIFYTIERYLHLRQRPHELVTITLWIMHTFVFDRFMFTPRLALLSPVRGCGKTTVLGMLSRLTYKAERYDHVCQRPSSERLRTTRRHCWSTRPTIGN